jgi:hypothetical protein
MRRLALLCLLATAACGGALKNDTGIDAQRYDAATLAAYRAALPGSGQLSAASPLRQTKAVGDVAAFPAMSRDIVAGVNGAVLGLLGMLHAVVDLPPTTFNTATQEFLWGPFNNDRGAGTIAAYIRRQPAGSDFQYAYAFLRGTSADLATLTPVIWGGANPDAANPDFGSGVTLWDFEADYAFEQAHDANWQSTAHDRGRFVALYGKGAATGPNDPPGATFAFDVAVFHAFVPKDHPANPPANAQYFYGRYVAGGTAVDFLDFAAPADITNPPDGKLEQLEVREAFLDAGRGRAEVTAQCPADTSCSLQPGETVHAVECWDDAVKRTYLNLSSTRGGGVSYTEGVSEAASCQTPFQATLDALHIPSLSSLDPNILAQMEAVAETGVPGGQGHP